MEWLNLRLPTDYWTGTEGQAKPILFSILLKRPPRTTKLVGVILYTDDSNSRVEQVPREEEVLGWSSAAIAQLGPVIE